MVSPHDSEVSEVEAFLEQEKRLQRLTGDGFPIWSRSGWNDELGTVWNIEDDLGVVLARLQFSCARAAPVDPSVSVIFRQRPIWRVDIVPSYYRHPNPMWAGDLGLSPIVEGSHEHNWPDNRDYIRRAAEWDLPAARPIQPQIKQLSQSLPWLAERINLRLDHGQRGFEVPSQAELRLFDG